MPTNERIEIEVAVRDSLSAALKEMGRHFDDLNRKARTTNETMSGLTRSLVGPVGLVAGFASVAKELDRFATAQLQMQNLSRDTGFAVESIRNMQLQLARAGIDAGTAAGQIGTLAAKLQQAGTYGWGSEFVQKLSYTNAMMRDGTTSLAAYVVEMTRIGESTKATAAIHDAYMRGNQAFKQYIVDITGLSHTYWTQMGQDTRDMVKAWEYPPEAVRQYHLQLTNLRQHSANIWGHIANETIGEVSKIIAEFETQGGSAKKFAETIADQIKLELRDLKAVIDAVKAAADWIDEKWKNRKDVWKEGTEGTLPEQRASGPYNPNHPPWKVGDIPGIDWFNQNRSMYTPHMPFSVQDIPWSPKESIWQKFRRMGLTMSFTEEDARGAYMGQLNKTNPLAAWQGFKDYFDVVPRQEKEGPLYGVHRAIKPGVQQMLDSLLGWGALGSIPGMSLPETAIVENWMRYYLPEGGGPKEPPFLKSRPFKLPSLGDVAGRLSGTVSAAEGRDLIDVERDSNKTLIDIRDILQKMSIGAGGAGDTGGGSTYGTGIRQPGGAAQAGLGGFRPNRGGTLGDRLNNPGNLKYGPFAKSMGATGAGPGGHAVFPDYETGRKAMETLLQQKAMGSSIAEMNQWYAEDPNWKNNVAGAMGVGTDWRLTSPGDVRTLADAIQRAEGTRVGGWKTGMDPTFDAAVDRMIADAAKEGISIRKGSGFRTYAEQARLYAQKPGLAAPPGRSRHEEGTARDLIYGPGGSEWAHRNAPRYGLRFPMSYEPWHIQPDDRLALRDALTSGGSRVQGDLNATVDFKNMPAGVRQTVNGSGFKTLRVTANKQGQKDLEGLMYPGMTDYTPYVP